MTLRKLAAMIAAFSKRLAVAVIGALFGPDSHSKGRMLD